MKESNLGFLAYNLLNDATALAGILDQHIEDNCIRVNFSYAAELIRNAQISAKQAADELQTILAEKGGEI